MRTFHSVKRNNAFHRVAEYTGDFGFRHRLNYALARLRRSEIRRRNLTRRKPRFFRSGEMTDVPLKTTSKVQVEKSRFFQVGQDSTGFQNLMEPACARSGRADHKERWQHFLATIRRAPP